MVAKYPTPTLKIEVLLVFCFVLVFFVVFFLYEKVNQDPNEFVYRKYIFTPSEVKHEFV